MGRDQQLTRKLKEEPQPRPNNEAEGLKGKQPVSLACLFSLRLQQRMLSFPTASSGFLPNLGFYLLPFPAGGKGGQYNDHLHCKEDSPHPQIPWQQLWSFCCVVADQEGGKDPSTGVAAFLSSGMCFLELAMIHKCGVTCPFHRLWQRTCHHVW